MAISESIKEATRKEWRKLGFYCEGNESHWLFIGSVNGLQNLCRILNQFADDPAHDHVSEHTHIDPYITLKITTWDKPMITSEGIYGQLQDLKNLAKLIEKKIFSHIAGGKFLISEEYVTESEMVLEFDVRGDDFDPASEDRVL